MGVTPSPNNADYWALCRLLGKTIAILARRLYDYIDKITKYYYLIGSTGSINTAIAEEENA